jgi:hypothetical protein
MLLLKHLTPQRRQSVKWRQKHLKGLPSKNPRNHPRNQSKMKTQVRRSSRRRGSEEAGRKCGRILILLAPYINACLSSHFIFGLSVMQTFIRYFVIMEDKYVGLCWNYSHAISKWGFNINVGCFWNYFHVSMAIYLMGFNNQCIRFFL